MATLKTLVDDEPVGHKCFRWLLGLGAFGGLPEA